MRDNKKGPPPPPPAPSRSSSTAPAAADTVVVAAGVLEGHCDLCWGRDNFAGMRLLRCRDCGVNFHGECYGMVTPSGSSTETGGIQCFACQAVGKTFRVRDGTKSRDGKDRLVAVTVKERPTECCLCGTDNRLEFLHAMHPVFDDHGRKGRQILLRATKQKPQRLAWAHTLCCVTICTLMSGCVYGCQRDGSYEGEGAESLRGDSNGDDTSVNSALVATAEYNANGDADITHYVYTLPKNPKRDRAYFPWLHLMEETRRELRCTLCGKNDNRKGTLRLVVQCCANDAKEFEEFSGYHRDLHGDTCFQSMHVGCALFRKQEDGSWPSERRVFFFPGSVKKGAEYREPVVNVFCDAHARDIRVNRPPSAPRLAPPVYKYIVPENTFTPIEDRKPAPVANPSVTPKRVAAVRRSSQVPQDRLSSGIPDRSKRSSLVDLDSRKNGHTATVRDGPFVSIDSVASRAAVSERRRSLAGNDTPNEHGFVERSLDNTRRLDPLNMPDSASGVGVPSRKSDGFASKIGAPTAKVAETPVPLRSPAHASSSSIICKPTLAHATKKTIAVRKKIRSTSRRESSVNPVSGTPVAGPRSKRSRRFKIAETKLNHYDETELEQKYREMIQDVQDRVLRESGFHDHLAASKAEWKERLNVSLTVFNAIWTRIEAALRMQAQEAENETEVLGVQKKESRNEAKQPKTTNETVQEETTRETEPVQGKMSVENAQEEVSKSFDWSCLVVGPSFNPDYDFSMGEIREEYEESKNGRQTGKQRESVSILE